MWALFYVTMQVTTSRNLYFGPLDLLYEIEEAERSKMGATKSLFMTLPEKEENYMLTECILYIKKKNLICEA